MVDTTISDDLAVLLNEPHQWPNYRAYRPLMRQRSEIRILQIYIDDASRKLCGTIQHVSLNDSQTQYEALSYCWGPPDRQQPIFIDGQDVLIRSSLHRFLTHLCNQPGAQKLPVWVDSICINQLDMGERSWQVALMGQIYSTASRVLIWLGDPTSEADYLFLYLQNCQDDRVQTCEHRTYLEEKAREGMLEIVRRPYWLRLWIVQEVVLARAVTVWCGHRSVCWFDLLHALEYLFKFSAPDSDQPTKVHNVRQYPEELSQLYDFMHKARSAPDQAIGESLQHVVRTRSLATRISQFHRQRCEDPKDRVYAVVSLAKDGADLDIDYSKTLLEISFDVVMLTWERQFHSGFRLDDESIEPLIRLTRDICGFLDVDSNRFYEEFATLLNKVDPLRTTHVCMHGLSSREDLMEAARQQKPSNVRCPSCGSCNEHTQDLVIKFSDFVNAIPTPIGFPSSYHFLTPGLADIEPRFYPHNSQDWPEKGDLAFSPSRMFWLGGRTLARQPRRLTFLFRPTNGIGGKLRFVGIIFTPSPKVDNIFTKSDLIELIAADGLHLFMANALKGDEGFYTVHFEINHVVLFLLSIQRSLYPAIDCNLLIPAQQMRASAGAESTQAFVTETQREQRLDFSPISIFRQNARYELRDICQARLDVGTPATTSLCWTPMADLEADLQRGFDDCITLPCHDHDRKDRRDHADVPRDPSCHKQGSLQERMLLNLADWIEVDQLVFQLGMMRASERRTSAENKLPERASRFEDFWMRVGLFVLTPFLWNAEEYARRNEERIKDMFHKVFAKSEIGDHEQQSLEYSRSYYPRIRPYFKVWQHYDQIRATIE